MLWPCRRTRPTSPTSSRRSSRRRGPRGPGRPGPDCLRRARNRAWLAVGRSHCSSTVRSAHSARARTRAAASDDAPLVDRITSSIVCCRGNSTPRTARRSLPRHAAVARSSADVVVGPAAGPDVDSSASTSRVVDDASGTTAPWTPAEGWRSPRQCSRSARPAAALRTARRWVVGSTPWSSLRPVGHPSATPRSRSSRNPPTVPSSASSYAGTVLDAGNRPCV